MSGNMVTLTDAQPAVPPRKKRPFSGVGLGLQYSAFLVRMGFGEP